MTERIFRWWADRWLLQCLVLVGFSFVAGAGVIAPEKVHQLKDDLRRAVIEAWDSEDDEPEISDAAVKDQPVADSSDSGEQDVPPSPPRVEVFRVDNAGLVVVANIRDTADGDLLNQQRGNALRSAVEALESLPQVYSVQWLNDIPDFNLFGLSGSLLPGPNASPRQWDSARTKILDNPLAVGQFLSSDARTAIMLLTIDWFDVFEDSDVTDALRIAATEAAGDDDIEFRVTGEIPLNLMIANSYEEDSTKYQIVGYAIMMITALVLFRGPAAVIIVAIAPALGVFWTMGLLRYFDLQDNPFTAVIVPVLISLVGLTDSVHLMVEVRNQRASGLSAVEAGRRAVARVGLACLLTSVTTAVAFASLQTAHHEVVREFGWCCVIGVAATFISVLTVIPLGCRSPLGRRLHVGLEKSLIHRQFSRIEPLIDWILRYRTAWSIAAIASTAACIIAASRLTPDEKRFTGLSDVGEAPEALRHIDEAMGGLEFARISIVGDLDVPEHRMLWMVSKVGKILNDEPLIGHPMGMHRLIDALPGERLNLSGLSRDQADRPEIRESIRSRLGLLDLMPASLKRAYYVPESRSATIQFRLKDIGIAAYAETFQRIEQQLDQLRESNPDFDLRLRGGAFWRWENLYQIVIDLTKSLTLAGGIIAIILMFVYRSIRLGLISIIPNVFPLAVTAAMLSVLGLHLEMVTVCAFTVCMGIAVDDTIHFLTRYREEQRTEQSVEEVTRLAFGGVGSALLMTTVVLVAGMASAITGDARDVRLFGAMGCVTLITALVADMTFLPALLATFGSQPKTDPKSES
ncbi:MAG: efflux RND transporter permease subunit [Planctomycetota bacterium]